MKKFHLRMENATCSECVKERLEKVSSVSFGIIKDLRAADGSEN